MDAIIIRIVDLPAAVYGVTRKDIDGNYNIYINARYDAETRAKTVRHELQHIRQNHFYELDKPAAQKEREVENCGDTEEDPVRELSPDLIYREG